MIIEKGRFILFFGCLCCIFGAVAQETTIAERLGYPKDAKLLIIHADDLGVAHSQNRASMKGLEETPVNSASIMVPCPWFPEIAAFARQNPSMDLGIHLTLNSEWKYYKWGPVSSKDSVPSLVNSNGYLYPLVPDLIAQAKAAEVEIELRNQVKKAYKSGIDITHLDAHMGAAVSTVDYTVAYLKLAHEFKLPVLLDQKIYDIDDPRVKKLLDDRTIVMDAIHTIVPHQYASGSKKYYTELLNALKPGITSLLIHLAYDDAEMKAVSIDHPDWGAAWRQADMDFFSSPECERLIEDNNIVLVTWRELRDKIVRAD